MKIHGWKRVKIYALAHSCKINKNHYILRNYFIFLIYLHMTKPVAAFSATPLDWEAPSAVTFTDASTNTPTQRWRDFGNGETSLEQNPVNTYYKKGAYTVTLIASNADGEDVETKVNYVNPVETTPGQENQFRRDEGKRGTRSLPPEDYEEEPLSTDRNYKIDYATDGTRTDHQDILA